MSGNHGAFLPVVYFPLPPARHPQRAHRLREVRQLETGHGIYFGLTRGRSRVFAVARNLDIDRATATALPDQRGARPFTARSPVPILTVAGASGLHQIRHHDGLLWLVNGQAPELLAADPQTGKRHRRDHPGRFRSRRPAPRRPAGSSRRPLSLQFAPLFPRPAIRPGPQLGPRLVRPRIRVPPCPAAPDRTRPRAQSTGKWAGRATTSFSTAAGCTSSTAAAAGCFAPTAGPCTWGARGGPVTCEVWRSASSFLRRTGLAERCPRRPPDRAELDQRGGPVHVSRNRHGGSRPLWQHLRPVAGE